PQYRVVWHDGRKWQSRQISDRTTPFSLAGGGTKMIPIARPRMVVDGRRGYYLFRDAERGSRVSMFQTRNILRGRWQVRDLTSFAVDAWEPSHDAELWKRQERLHLFVQATHQGDGERTVESQPTMVYVLEIE
ncbi:MAG: neuraminidase, partial [Alistipes sp.]|nr:neuraminidase [Alistipes sp.]